MKKLLTIGIILVVVLAMVAMPAAAMKPTVVHKATGSGTLIQTLADLWPWGFGPAPVGNANVDYSFIAQQDSTGRISGHTTITIITPGVEKWTFKGDVKYVSVADHITSKDGYVMGNIITSSIPNRNGGFYVLRFVDGQPDAAVVSVFPSEEIYNAWLIATGTPATPSPLIKGTITIV